MRHAAKPRDGGACNTIPLCHSLSGPFYIHIYVSRGEEDPPQACSEVHHSSLLCLGLVASSTFWPLQYIFGFLLSLVHSIRYRPTHIRRSSSTTATSSEARAEKEPQLRPTGSTQGTRTPHQPTRRPWTLAREWVMSARSWERSKATLLSHVPAENASTAAPDLDGTRQHSRSHRDVCCRPRLALNSSLTGENR